MRLRYRTPLLLSALAAALATALGTAGCADGPDDPLVGTWQDDRWADTVDVFRRQYTFDQDGGLTIRMRRPPASDTLFSARYTVEQDSLLTLADDRGSEQFVARVWGDTLLLRTPEMTTTFVRVGD